MAAPSVPGARPPRSGITKMIPRIPLRGRIRRGLRGVWPIAAWLLAVGAALWLYRLDGGRGRIPAIVEARQISVSAGRPARVEAVLVVAGQAVRRGQVVATLDASEARSRLDLAIAELTRLEAEIPASAQEWRIAEREALFEAERMRVDLDGAARSEAAASRGFANDVESIEERIVVVEGEIARDRAERRQIEAELTRLEKLGAESVSALTMEVLDARRDAASERIEGNERRLALLKRQQEAVVARGEAWEARSPIECKLPAAPEVDEGIHLAPLFAAVRVQEERVRQARGEIEALSLCAPAHGHVGEVLLRPGELALAGAPILSITTSRPGRLVAFVPEDGSADVGLGEEVVIRPAHRNGDPVRGRVVGLGASIVEAPVRLRPSPTVPIWGREVYLEAEGAPAFLAGEECRVVFAR